MTDDTLTPELLHLATEHGDPHVRDVCRRALTLIDPTAVPMPEADVALVADAMSGHLCSLLANRVAEQRGRRPRITARWIQDMGLLLRRGPKHVDSGPMDAETIAEMIDLIFTRLGEVNGRGFCWADQVRSPSALRDHWEQLEVALRRQPAPGPSTGEVVEAVRRLKALGL
jgi:hypothetical protein